MSRSWPIAVLPILIFSLAAARDAEGRILLAPERVRRGHFLYRHDFENRLDPDTGEASPDSAALNGQRWPDFWEPIRAVGFPEYLLDEVAIIPDESGQIPGSYRDVPNHVLRIGYDGGQIGLRTRIPVSVSPETAYEFSLFSRGSGLQGSLIRAGVDWLRVDSTGSRLLRSDEIPDLPSGQIDWPVSPHRLLVNHPPAQANAARFFLVLGRRPDEINGSFQGEFLVDDISFNPIPQINIGKPEPLPGKQNFLATPIHYSGLADNIPDPGNPGYFRGKRYFRRMKISDLLNRTIQPETAERKSITANDTGNASDNISLPADRFGVYYLDITLYGAEGRPLANSVRAIAVPRPTPPRDPLNISPASPVFGLGSGLIPEDMLPDADFIRLLLLNSGARSAKIIPWLDSYPGDGDKGAHYRGFAEILRSVKSAGIKIVGDIRPPSGIFGSADLATVMANNSARLIDILSETGQQIGLFMDAWQWGDDSDGSLAGVSPDETSERIAAALAEFAEGLPMAATRPAITPGENLFPFKPGIVNLFFPHVDASRIWESSARVFPWLFEPYFRERGRIYPPAGLSRLARPPPGNELETRFRNQGRTSSWITLESPPSPANEPNAWSERDQLEKLLIGAVQAAILAPDVIFLGKLFEPERGMLRPNDRRDNLLETMARPTYLAAGVISEFLEGAEYLGQLGLLPPFEAHVFRRPGTDDSIIAIWHKDPGDERYLPRAEIAEGPALALVDWAGNREALPNSIPVRRIPSFITGLPASMALTRMSVRLAPEPPLLAVTRRQNQTLEVVNHLPSQTTILFRLNYAARQADGGMENNWTVTPGEMRINLPPVSPAFTPGRLKLSVSPDPNSQIEIAGAGWADKSGMKLAKATMRINAAKLAEMTLYLPFKLNSELDVDIEELRRDDDPNFATLQLKIRWFPLSPRREMRVLPYYIKHGGMKEPLPFPIRLQPLPPESRGRPETGFETVELRIPRRPRVKTWIGLNEDGGSSFFLADVTPFLGQP
ncbi:MAG: hypothetical protein LBU64_08090 [Planctomycetota bacterium]|jgi:hypothetical protein|nr:hypothetical protein [Planctomycetota bacterium]